jgi:hypothetical protein
MHMAGPIGGGPIGGGGGGVVGGGGGVGTLVVCSPTRAGLAVVAAVRLMVVQDPSLKTLMGGGAWLRFSSSAG